MLGLLVLLVAGLVAGLAQVPLVALGPGPSFDTLGEVEGKTVVRVDGRRTYPTTGHLNMTTVAVTDGLTALTALRFWADPTRRVVPRAAIYPPGESDEQVERENARQFSNSETNAEVAALSYLKEPMLNPVKVVVEGTVDGGPSAGVLRSGDQLLTLDGMPLVSAAQVTQLMTKTKPGDKVTIGYQRGGSPPSMGIVTVGVRPSRDPGGAPDGPQGFLGIIPGEVPYDLSGIKIELDDIGGPSAGLIFTLALIDKLTPGNLTGGRFIAGTGTISADGRVGRIDGIAQKMIGARAAGATIFLVPTDNCNQARSADHAGLQLVKVATLSDAVNGLKAFDEGHTPPSC